MVTHDVTNKYHLIHSSISSWVVGQDHKWLTVWFFLLHKYKYDTDYDMTKLSQRKLYNVTDTPARKDPHHFSFSTLHIIESWCKISHSTFYYIVERIQALVVGSSINNTFLRLHHVIITEHNDNNLDFNDFLFSFFDASWSFCSTYFEINISMMVPLFSSSSSSTMIATTLDPTTYRTSGPCSFRRRPRSSTCRGWSCCASCGPTSSTSNCRWESCCLARRIFHISQLPATNSISPPPRA